MFSLIFLAHPTSPICFYTDVHSGHHSFPKVPLRILLGFFWVQTLSPWCHPWQWSQAGKVLRVHLFPQWKPCGRRHRVGDAVSMLGDRHGTVLLTESPEETSKEPRSRCASLSLSHSFQVKALSMTDAILSSHWAVEHLATQSLVTNLFCWLLYLFRHRLWW